MSFASPLGLLALLALPLALLGWRALGHRRQRYAVDFTNLDLLAGVASTCRSYRRWLPLALALAALIALALALARPQSASTSPAKRATIVLLFDTSRSIRADDVQPSRLRSAELVALAFLKRLPDTVRVGVVSLGSDEPEGFEPANKLSDDPQLIASPTTDRTLLRNAITSLRLGFKSAIDDGLLSALALLQQPARARAAGQTRTPARPRGAIILLSDPANNAAVDSTLQAAWRARTLRIPVDTVALGTGSEPGLAPNPTTLAQIAELSGGKFFSATDQTGLSSLYRGLASTLTHTRQQRQLAVALDAAGAALLACATITSLLWRPPLP